jgi:hypothetical protein
MAYAFSNHVGRAVHCETAWAGRCIVKPHGLAVMRFKRRGLEAVRSRTALAGTVRFQPRGAGGVRLQVPVSQDPDPYEAAMDGPGFRGALSEAGRLRGELFGPDAFDAAVLGGSGAPPGSPRAGPGYSGQARAARLRPASTAAS